ncbi:XRN 5'-3' exonuclease N-terminus-domain-containing protein [Limtongia smithiae]|uniref:XRN 5'-3' exonuclease N-terminus-domain-containing protein n=1 Tax=Limtongia smithiae TaxID=1125753 RepID=UPI0034CFF8E6
MGIPKFFRWISERYPLISQLVEGENIPEFDNLYLDMNGIIHNCTHKDSDDVTFRLSEDEMYIAIFSYIELLFDKIKPRKLFFMAIDGVAPRAKMNQQRSRRFRTALDAKNAHEKALKEGTELPKESPFDSNAITPGTEFMSRLSSQLKYFISKKVTQDARWQGIEIIFSGHEVPGEGEHKIMEYIRSAKSQPDYQPNICHCLYGLDADLIMLGLLSHDPHFCLLREEVFFGPSRGKSKELSSQKFFLLHLSLVREYLELEFMDIQNTMENYDFEKVLDDFILLCMFVGNDFLPNLPYLHINDGALTIMFESYKTAFPKMNGYLNNSGTISLENLRVLLKELVPFELKIFESTQSNDLYLTSKSKVNGHGHRDRGKDAPPLNAKEKIIFEAIEKFVLRAQDEIGDSHYQIPYQAVSDCIDFISTLASKLSLESNVTNNMLTLSVRKSDDSDETDEEAEFALQRVLQQYRSRSQQSESKQEDQTDAAKEVMSKFVEWKDNYYKNKLGFSIHDEAKLRAICQNYVQGLQWVLNYYFKGVSSWSWYFAYHYAPILSDITKGLDADMNFQLGQPFTPFEQLMGVLPDLSNHLVPKPFRGLMHDPESPILDFYPQEFELDLNGKKMDWEAVVIIPFVDEKRLLSAMKPGMRLLTPAEKERDGFGQMLKCSYDPALDFTYESPLPAVFPKILQCCCAMTDYHFPPMEGKQYKSALCEGVLMRAQTLAGFPSLHTLSHTAELTTRHQVSVFQQNSRREAIVLTIHGAFDGLGSDKIAQKLLTSRVFVGWPYLHEAQTVAVTDELFKYTIQDMNGKRVITRTNLLPKELDGFGSRSGNVAMKYAKLGVDIGPVDVIATVRLLKGMVKSRDGALLKEYEPENEVDAAVQTVLTSVTHEDMRFQEQEAPSLEQKFPIGTRCFFLGREAYGQPMVVTRICDPRHVDITVSTSPSESTSFGTALAAKAAAETRYYQSIDICRQVHISALLLSKIMSRFTILFEDSKKANIGLNLKFEGRKTKVIGYTRRTPGGWEYSERAKELILEYVKTFPDLFAGLQRLVHSDNPSIELILNLPRPKANERLAAIKLWLKKKESIWQEPVSVDAERLEPGTVKVLETMMDSIIKARSPPETKEIKSVPGSIIMLPADAVFSLGAQNFGLGDRVVYVRDSGNVPIASLGTVIGIDMSSGHRVLDVVFDLTFLGGTSLGGRCSHDRGMTVEASTLLNISAYYRDAALATNRARRGGGNNRGGRGGTRGGMKVVVPSA